MGEITIDDLLNALQNPEVPEGTVLSNSSDTWRRIGEKDRFDELGLEKGELEDFLSDWIAQNPYSNI